MTLRDYTPADIEALVTLANNKNVSRYLIYTFPYPYTRRDAESWISEGAHAGGAITKVILLDGQFVGSVGIAPQSGWRSHGAEIGYWVGEPYWGQGIATVALRLMTEQAVTLHACKKLTAPILSPNQASRRVAEKCGYQLEGILKAEVSKEGAFYDVHSYAKCFV